MIQTNVSCRPSGALVYLLCRVFYKHAAPLGLNAESNSLVVIADHGVVSRFLIRVLRAIGLIRDSDKCFMSPLWGFKAFGVSYSINMPPLWG